MSSIYTSAVGRIAPLPKVEPAVGGSGGSGGSDGVGFAKTLASVIGDASKAEQHADNLSSEFAAGNPEVGIHETVIAVERANVQIRYAVTLKNKLLDAYRELMNTQI